MCDCSQHTGRITAEQIQAGQTPRGGWTRAQLAEWGVPWPPPRGWKQRLIHGADPVPLVQVTACEHCRDHDLSHEDECREGGYHYREATARLDLANERRCFMRDIPDADVERRMKEDRR